jgi:hypothetical protein
VEDHRHADDGSVIEVVASAEEHVAETEVVASADVEVARINAERDIALARIQAREVPRDLEAELAAALAELDALKIAMQPPVAEIPPEVPAAPVAIVNEVAPEPEPSLPEPEHHHEEPKPRKSSGSGGLGFWG